jgi:PAS domain S-box-containing protein
MVDPVFDHGDRLAVTRMLVEDISAEMVDASHLRNASVRFRIAFENAPIGMHLSTVQGRFLEVNRALCSMLGYSEAQLLTMQVWDVVHPDDLAVFAPARAALFSGTTHPIRMDSRFVTADGAIRWCRLEAILPNGSEGYLVSQVVDISDLIEAQQHLAGVVKAKDRFVATVSHELRTPLAGVLGFASELRDRADRFTRAEIVEFSRLIAQGCVTASNLVEDLLVAARLDTEDLFMRPELLDLHWQAFNVTSEPEVVLLIGGKPITLQVESTVAWADPNRVREIIRNLVVNAAQHGVKRITIVAGTLPDSGNAFLRVLDDGPGVATEVADRLFQAYQHGPQGEGGRTDSVGLGLYISRKLARLMGGDVTYRRQPGTTIFELTLPSSDQTTNQDA